MKLSGRKIKLIAKILLLLTVAIMLMNCSFKQVEYSGYYKLSEYKETENDIYYAFEEGNLLVTDLISDYKGSYEINFSEITIKDPLDKIDGKWNYNISDKYIVLKRNNQTVHILYQ